MIAWLTPSMIASRASGILTFTSTWSRVAPNELRRLDRLRRDVLRSRAARAGSSPASVEHRGDDTWDARDRH